jgi:hypothetical protein
MSQYEISPHLKEQFLREFTPSERLYFLRMAKEAVFINGYVPGHDLYYYCYFLTQKKRLESLTNPHSSGLARYLVVECRKDIEDTIKIYKERLEKDRRTVSFKERENFIRLLEGPA